VPAGLSNRVAECNAPHPPFFPRSSLRAVIDLEAAPYTSAAIGRKASITITALDDS
jgi:hypothetical protein